MPRRSSELNEVLAEAAQEMCVFSRLLCRRYIYLIFAEPNVASLDTYTFNTEGHPFLQDAPLFDYSSINVGALPSPQGGATPAPTKASDATPPLPKFSGMPAGSVQGEIEKALDGLVSFFGGKPLANKSKRAH